MPIIGSIYLSTLLLEKNRSNGKGPSLLVSDWVEQTAEAGFAGLEIWINHLLFSSRSEWELIREKAQDSDLALPMVTATLPSDDSDKSQRLRDSVLEACDYFQPDGLKFSIADDARARKASSLEEALESIKGWARDVPKEIGLFYEGRMGESGVDGLAVAKRILTEARYKAVLHPFLMSAKEIEPLLAAHGDFIGNLGVQMKKMDQWASLPDGQSENLKIISATRKAQFKGTWSLEFTKGAEAKGEDIETLFDNAETDLNFLTEALARSNQEKEK